MSEQYIEEWIRKRTGLGDALTAENLRVWQKERLREAEEYAVEHSRFYRDRLTKTGFSIAGASRKYSMDAASRNSPQVLASRNSPQVLASQNPPQVLASQNPPQVLASRNSHQVLPETEPSWFTTPEDVRREPEAFLCVSPKEIARVITLQTSGSQGKPKRLFFTADDLLSTADFFEPGMAYMTKPGQRVTVFMEGPGTFSVGGLLKIALKRRHVETEVHGFVRDIPAAGKAAEGAQCLVGAPGQMMLLAEYFPGLRPETVLLSGDYVPDSIVKRLQNVWGCQVFNHWGMTETGYGGGVECGCHQGFHMRDADLLVEIIDPQTGQEVPAGQYGEVVISTFSRKGMPLLHYRTGDIGRMLTEPCPCGGILPRLDKVMGRLENTILLPGGGILSIHLLDEVVFGCEGVRDYAAVLAEKKKLTLTVDGVYDSGNLRQKLEEKWPELELELRNDSVNTSRKRSLSQKT